MRLAKKAIYLILAWWTQGLWARCTDIVPNSWQDSLEFYWDSGFPAARLQCDSLGISMIRGDAWVWATARQVPLGKTDTMVFARLSGLQTGAPVALKDLQRAQRRLARTGYFAPEGEPQLFRIAKRNRLVPVFPMRDQAANQLEALLGYGGEDGWSGQILLTLRNMAGTARDLDFQGSRADRQSEGTLAYKEPDVLGTGWNLRLQGSVSDLDSVRERSVGLEGSRDIGFEWQYAIGGGAGSRDWRSWLVLRYDGRDRLPLPREGATLSGQLAWYGPRGSDTVAQRVAGTLSASRLWPLPAQAGIRFSGLAYGMLPSEDYAPAYLYAIGGRDDFRALRPRSIRTRAYGISEVDLQWLGIAQSAAHLFFQPGVYRDRSPGHGWQRVWGYGLGFEQARGSVAVSLYYTLQQGIGLGEGLLNLSVKSYF